MRSEEHTSELQSLRHLVCRLLLATLPTDTYTLSLHDALPICPLVSGELLKQGDTLRAHEKVFISLSRVSHHRRVTSSEARVETRSRVPRARSLTISSRRTL